MVSVCICVNTICIWQFLLHQFRWWKYSWVLWDYNVISMEELWRLASMLNCWWIHSWFWWIIYVIKCFGISICVCVCFCICVFSCVCNCVFSCVCICVCICVCVLVAFGSNNLSRLHVGCLGVIQSICVYVCVCVCIRVWVCICLFMFMYICWWHFSRLHVGCLGWFNLAFSGIIIRSQRDNAHAYHEDGQNCDIHHHHRHCHLRHCHRRNAYHEEGHWSVLADTACKLIPKSQNATMSPYNMGVFWSCTCFWV